MPRIDAQIKGLQFAQKVQDGVGLDLKKLKAEFLKLSSPDAQQAAINALKDSGDPMLQGLAAGLEKALPSYQPPTPTYTPRVSSAG